MLLVYRLHNPFFAPKGYLSNLNLNREAIRSFSPENYLLQHKLKKNAKKAAESISELKTYVFNRDRLDNLHETLTFCSNEVFNSRPLSLELKNRLDNDFMRLKSDLKEDRLISKTYSSLMFVENVLAFIGFGVMGVVGAIGSMTAASIGGFVLGAAIELVAVAVMTCSAYNAYQESRFLLDRQEKEIGEYIDNLKNFGSTSEQEDSLCPPYEASIS